MLMEAPRLTAADFDFMRKEHELRREWDLHRKTPKRWDIIRRVYELHRPYYMERRCDPYFLAWDFTPIEDMAWFDIRYFGLPFYPQFPVLEYFLDFADPRLRIGLELDGAAYHDPEKDRRRDERLWQVGWRIFRIPGRETVPTEDSKGEVVFDRIRELQEEGEEDAEYRLLRQWGERWSEGFFWALGVHYYRHEASEDAQSAAEVILRKHRGIEFPLGEDD